MKTKKELKDEHLERINKTLESLEIQKANLERNYLQEMALLDERLEKEKLLLEALGKVK